MFGRKKKEPKVEKVFNDKTEKEESSQNQENTNGDAENQEQQLTGLEEFEDPNAEVNEDDGLTEIQKQKYEKLGNVKDKISKILKSSNVEIVDENIGDEYDLDYATDSEKQQQQDYDSLKALFGNKDKSKKQELTLTIDDFDYTYVGQYIDEYDLMHMKGIKKVRLQRKYPKHLKKFLIAACVVLIAGLGGFLGYYFTRETPVYLKSVALNQTENNYYIYENFDYTGLYLITEYSNGVKQYIPLNGNYLVDIIGRVERNGDDIQFTGGTLAELTFSYQGFNVKYSVNILEKIKEGLIALYSPGFFNLQSGEYITDDYLKILCDYGDYGQELLDLSSSEIELYVNDTKLNYVTNYGETKSGFLLTENLTESSTIRVSYQGIELEFTYDEMNNFARIKI